MLIHAAAVSFLVLAPAVFADPLIDNLAEPTRDASTLSGIEPDLLWGAQSFVSPSSLRLRTIEVPLGNAFESPEVVAQLRSGLDPSGPLLASFAVPALSASGIDILTLTPDADVQLEPGETYWLLLGPAAGGSFQWAYAEGNNFLGIGSFGNYNYSTDAGATWTNYGSDNPFKVRVNVEPPPGCPADLDDGSNTGTPDGGVTIEDLLYYVTIFADGLHAADLDDGSGAGTPDGGVTIDDLLYFLERFAAGC